MIVRNILIACVAACAPGIASAQVVISEIMYDLAEGSDTGREWVEVHNTGNEAVNLTEWKLFEGDTSHGLKAIGEEMLAPDGYAIIADNSAKFAADWSSYSGLVFDSAFSLNNSGETLVLRCCGKEPVDKDSVTYNNTGGGNGDGLTLHRESSSLTSGRPSPGNGTIEAAPPPPPPEEEEEETPEPVVQKTVPKTEVVQKTETAQKKEEKVAAEQESQTITETQPSTVVVKEDKPVPPKPTKKQNAPPPEVGEDVEEEIGEIASEAETQVALAGQAAAETAIPKAADNSWLWWTGAVGIALLGAGGAYMAGRGSRKKWEIEEIE